MPADKNFLRHLLVLACAAALCTSAPAFAQTADGVSGARPVSTDVRDAAEEAEDLLALAEYQPRSYQLSLRAWGVKIPKFALGLFFDLHENQWTEGTRNFAYGIEFARRTPDKYDLVLALDWANMSTPDGFWLEGDDPVADADWGENNLSIITADVGVHWFTNLDKRDRWQLYYGVGIGLSIVLGEFRKYDLDTAACGLATAEQRNSNDISLLEGCYDANGDPTILSDFTPESIPPVLPSLTATLGLRHIIADRVAVSLEGGLRGFFFYGGLSVGYVWDASPR